MTEQASEKVVELRQPTQCILWEHPDRVAGQFAQAFEVVESYENSSHLSRSLYKCGECGQLYFLRVVRMGGLEARQRQAVFHRRSSSNGRGNNST